MKLSHKQRAVLLAVYHFETEKRRAPHEGDVWETGRARSFWSVETTLYSPLKALVERGLLDRQGNAGGYRYALTTAGRSIFTEAEIFAATYGPLPSLERTENSHGGPMIGDGLTEGDHPSRAELSADAHEEALWAAVRGVAEARGGAGHRPGPLDERYAEAAINAYLEALNAH